MQNFFAERIELLRNEHGLSQRRFAELFGFKQTAYSAWKVGRNEPNFSVISDICKQFNVTSDWLIGLTDVRSTPGRACVRESSEHYAGGCLGCQEKQRTIDSLLVTIKHLSRDHKPTHPDRHHKA